MKVYFVNKTYDSFGGNDCDPLKAFSTLDKAKKYCETLPERNGRKRIEVFDIDESTYAACMRCEYAITTFEVEF